MKSVTVRLNGDQEKAIVKIMNTEGIKTASKAFEFILLHYAGLVSKNDSLCSDLGKEMEKTHDLRTTLRVIRNLDKN